jgi:hypothetical protein
MAELRYYMSECFCNNFNIKHYFNPITCEIVYYPYDNMYNYFSSDRCKYFGNENCCKKLCNFKHVKDIELPIDNDINDCLIGRHTTFDGQIGWKINKEPVDSYKEPVDSYKEPIDSYKEPVDSYTPPSKIYKTTNSYTQPTKNYKESINSYTSFEKTFKETVDSYTTLTKTNKEYFDSYKEPVDTYKEPDNSYKEPVDTYKEPIDSYKEPDNSYKEPVDTYKEPIDSYKEPDDSYKEPVDTYKEPIDSYKEPDDSYKEPPSNYRKLSLETYKELIEYKNTIESTQLERHKKHLEPCKTTLEHYKEDLTYLNEQPPTFKQILKESSKVCCHYHNKYRPEQDMLEVYMDYKTVWICPSDNLCKILTMI